MKITVIRTNKKSEVVEEILDLNKLLIDLGIGSTVFLASSSVGFAEGSAKAPDLSNAFDPLIETLKSLAKPAAIGFMIKGGLEVISGNEHKGKKTMKHAVQGFVGIQWIPVIFDIIANASKTAGKF